MHGGAGLGGGGHFLLLLPNKICFAPHFYGHTLYWRETLTGRIHRPALDAAGHMLRSKPYWMWQSEAVSEDASFKLLLVSLKKYMGRGPRKKKKLWHIKSQYRAENKSLSYYFFSESFSSNCDTILRIWRWKGPLRLWWCAQAAEIQKRERNRFNFECQKDYFQSARCRLDWPTIKIKKMTSFFIFGMSCD